MGKNYIADITFGQTGSTYSIGAVITPPTGQVFVAIQMLEDTTFTTLTSDNETVGTTGYTGAGTGGIVIPSGQVFPKGTTLYGRYKSVDPNAGKIIAYSAY
tara:strand:+ start:42 stop:344 length:303 start_codon:yes stop_codon:yes gene_type:complete